MQENEGGSGSGRRLHSIVAGLAALMIAGVAQFALERASHTILLLVAAIVMAAVSIWGLAFRDSISWLLGKIFSLPREMTTRAKGAVAGGTALILVVAATVAMIEFTRGDVCPQALELRILAPPEGVQAIREVTQEYAKATARENAGCPTVHPYVYSAGTSTVIGALARKWTDAKDEHPLEQLGPRPDIWFPDSMLDVRQVTDIVVRGALPSPLWRVTSIAYSPIVLVGTDVTAVPDSGTDTLPKLLSAVLDQHEHEPSLSASDPGSSTAGLLAAEVYLRDAGGEMVRPDVARERARIVFDSSNSATDEASLLCGYLQDKKAPAAMLTSLRTWQRFVDGKALGGVGCPAPVPPPLDLPEPVVIKSAPALDHPLVQFTWTGDRHRRAVVQFREWLQNDAADPHLQAAGLGEPHSACSDLDRNACIPQEPKKTLSLFEQAKRQGRVLLAVDTSGSMAEATGPAGKTRFTVAEQGVGIALGQLGNSDEFGLWSFPVLAGNRSNELVGIAAGSPRQRSLVKDALADVKPAGATPLYATILAGMRKLSGGADDERIQALVVLTDGEDTSSKPGLQKTAEQVRHLAGSDVRLYVIATGEARCRGPLNQLTHAGHGECLPAGSDEVPDTMGRLFKTLWSGQ